VIFDVEDNYISGSLPTLPSTLGTSDVILIARNRILTLTARLGTLNLRFNLLRGNLPKQPFLNLRKSLRSVFMCCYANVILKPNHAGKLDTSVNFFAGGIPTTLGLSTKLVELDLSQNDPAGPIPSELGLLTDLSEYL
jgi:uncharacterized protein YunC (DUF1805 family)